MNYKTINVRWPNGKTSRAIIGKGWLDEAKEAGIFIPTGCLNGNCGACEIEVNGEVIRACISKVKGSKLDDLNVEFFYDPYW